MKDLSSLGKQYNSKLGLDNFKYVNGEIYKLCTKCLQYKPMTLEFFSKRSNVKCGFCSHCKLCDKEKEKNRIRILPFDKLGNLYCLRCKTYKPISEFYENASTTKNRNFYSNNCKLCESERHKEYRESHITNDINLFFIDLVTGCKGRAYRSGKFKCDITKELIIDLYEKLNHKCALSGIEMTTIKGKGRFPFNASIDRIEPGKDYTLDNVRLVCNHVNVMKLDLSDSELIYFCKQIINNLK